MNLSRGTSLDFLVGSKKTVNF